MRKRKSKLFFWGIVLFYFLFDPGIAGAQEPSLTVSVSSTRILQNSVFEVQFELQNAGGIDFQAPNFNNFRVVGGPAMGSSTMIINGKVTRSQSWTYSLLAPEAGRFTIAPAQVIAGRRKLASQPLTVDVLAAEDMATRGPGTGNEAIKLIAQVNPGDYYPGQQIVLEYKLLFTENIQTVTTISEDDYAGLFVQNFNSFSKEASYETINGVAFASRIVKAVALFAHQSGTYTIDPMVMMVGINAPYPGNQGFFTMRRLHNIQVVSEGLTIHVKPLPPDPTSTGFSGAVGQYSLSTLEAGKTDITTDEDFHIKIEIKGNGDARRWDPPAVVTDSNFDIYDPKIIDDKIMDTEGSVLHTRTVEYRLVPREPGDHTVFIPFRYFNPATKKYETIRSDTFHLHVTQGTNTPGLSIDDKSGAVTPRPLKKVSNIRTDDRFWLSIPHLALFGLLFGGTFWGIFVTYKRKKEASIPEVEKLRSVASRNARHQLDLLHKTSDTLSDQEFYEKATEVYYKFLSEKFSILPGDLDADKIASHFSTADIPVEIRERAMRYYDHCLSVRYGGVPGGYSREEMLHACKEIIDALDSAHHLHI